MSVQTVAATDSLNSYFGEICAQAGLAMAGGRPYRCSTTPSDDIGWSTLVRTGMNDIDHRCDLYLNWLEAKRNEKPFVDASISSIGTATAGVLGVAAPGTAALSYVAIALGFASSTYNAYYNRALLGLEPSTIKLTVDSRRLAFRHQFLDARYNDRADVIYALRSYLKICTPQTITMDVNSFARAGATGETPPQERNLALERETLDTVRLVNSPAYIPPRKAPPTLDQVAEIFSGKGYVLAQLKLARRKLCVHLPDSDNSKTKNAVRIWEQGVYASAPDLPGHNGKIDDPEWKGYGKIEGLVDIPDCDPRWSNPAERALFQGKPIVEANFINALKATTGLADVKSLDDPAARKAVAAARTSCVLPAPEGLSETSITTDLVQKVLDWVKKPKGDPCV